MLRTAVLAGLVTALVATAPAFADIRINEVESQDLTGGPDWVELTNTGAAAVDIGGYTLRDDGNNTMTIPAGTTLAPGAFFAINTSFGLGNPDGVTVLDGATTLDTYSYVAHAPATYGRCPDGTGALTWTTKVTKGAANACAPMADPFPGGLAGTVLDEADAVSAAGNFSGLAYQPSGTRAKGVLWGVLNNPGTLYKMVPSGAIWTVKSGGGFTRPLGYADGYIGQNNPDAEGVTRADGDPNGIYVSVERDGNGGSAPAVLRYDVTSADAKLKATNTWDLDPDLPPMDANASLEAIAWMPDSFLVSKGLFDEAKGAKYNPADYPGHGSGLFFVGIEQGGGVIAYALKSNNTYQRIATIDSGFPAVMDLEFEPETGYLWAVCDDGCEGRSVTLEIAQSGANAGKFAVTHNYARPLGMANLNNEGFAIAPQLECAGGKKPTFYADDSDSGGNSLRGGTINCTVLPDQADPTPTATPTAVPTVMPTPVPTVVPTPKDTTAPALTVSLKVGKSGAYKTRGKGTFGVALTLNEQADLTITVKAGKSAKAKARTIYTTTRKGVAAGKPTLKFTLSKKVRKALKKGETLTLTVAARDAAGNTATKTAKTVKVP
jgi:hypothetical protein